MTQIQQQIDELLGQRRQLNDALLDARGCSNPYMVSVENPDGTRIQVAKSCQTRTNARFCPFCTRKRERYFLRIMKDGLASYNPGVGDQLLFITARAPSFGAKHVGPGKPPAYMRDGHPDPVLRRCFPCGRFHPEWDVEFVGAPINIWEYDYEGHVEYNALISGLIANSTKTLSRRLTGREQSIPRFHVLEWHKSGLLHPHILLIVKRKPATDLDLYTDKDGNRRSKMVEAVFTHTSKNSPFRPGHKVKWGTSIMALAIQAPKDANRIAGYMASLLRYTTKDLLLDQGTTIDIATGLRAQHFAYLDCFAEHIGKADTHDTPSKDEIMASYTRKIMDRKYRGKRAFGFNGQMFASSKTWSPLTLAACHVHAIRQARAAGITQAPKDTRSLEEAIIKIDHRIRGLQEIRHHGHLF